MSRLVRSKAALLGLVLTAPAFAGDAPEWNRRYVSAKLTNTGVPGEVLIEVQWFISRSADAPPTTLDLSTDFYFYQGGQLVFGPLSLSCHSLPPSDGCGPIGCADELNCAFFDIDGVLRFGTCTDAPWHPDSTPYCSCGIGGTTFGFGTGFSPGEPVEVVLTAAPNSMPESHTLDNLGRLTLSNIGATAYCHGDGTGGSCPCGNTGLLGQGCASGLGPGARLSSIGSASIGADDLQLQAATSVPGQPGLFFQGENPINGGSGVPFGDGLRCAGGMVVRLEVRTADATGGASSTVSVATTGGVVPGDIKRYQWWCRDPTGSPCGSGFNLSNGLEVSWTP